MSFCPECRVEYLPEITKCPDCGAKLVDKLPDFPGVEWVALPTVTGVVFAQMIQGALEKIDIPSYVHSFWSSGAMGVISSTSMNAKVMVPKSDYDRALEVQESMVDHE